MSGQGPYFGQMVWFRTFHSEKIPSAIQRYYDEVYRVIGVIDAHLKKKGSSYLVGDRVTYADLMFIAWTYIFEERYPGEFDLTKYDAYSTWMKKLRERDAVKKVWAEWLAAKAAAK
jgi:glutathione S-transferase